MDKLPPEVIAASRRLEEHSIVQQPPLPKTFRRIVDIDKKREEILAKGTSITRDDWCLLKDLREERRDLSRAAAILTLRTPTPGGTA